MPGERMTDPSIIEEAKKGKGKIEEDEDGTTAKGYITGDRATKEKNGVASEPSFSQENEGR